MQKSIFAQLPDEIIRDILLYDRRFIWRENRLIFISRFSKEDERYSLLKNIPRKWNLYENTWSVIFCLENKKRFVLGYKNVVNDVWRYFFVVFLYDPLMKEMIEDADMNIVYTLL